MPMQKLVFCALFAALIALGAFVRIPLPPVPFTLQFLFANLAGLLLGAKYGALSVIVYVLAGLLGLPVFVSGGGLGYIFQPTFGYLLGFIGGAAISGYYAKRITAPSFKRYFIAGLLHLVVLYFCGLTYLYVWYYLQSPIGWWALLLQGGLPFLIPDIFLCGISATLAQRLRKRGAFDRIDASAIRG